MSASPDAMGEVSTGYTMVFFSLTEEETALKVFLDRRVSPDLLKFNQRL